MLVALRSSKAQRPCRIRSQQPDMFTLYDVRYLRSQSVTSREALCKDERGSSAAFAHGSVCDQPTGETISKKWWSQTGSNRRPQACKASALPTELWPRTVSKLAPGRRTPSEVVGLGRLELPTSRLSSARSNQLSYKPDPPHITPPALPRQGKARAGSSLVEERETKTAASRKIGLTGRYV